MINSNKKYYNFHIFKKVFIIGISTIFITSFFPLTNITTKGTLNNNVEWNVTLNINETNGKTDYIVFGETDDANDGSPPDSYDTPKSPPPLQPYIRAWFNDHLISPYDTLLKDYRKYPNSYKIWNLSLQWVPSDYTTATVVTISWDTDEVDGSEYDSVNLYDDDGIPLTDMITSNSYTFACPAMTIQSFKIICEYSNNPPKIPSEPSGETNGYQGTSYTYSTSTTDPDGDTLYYLFGWGDITNSGWLGPYSNGETCSTSHTWESPGTYNIRVKAKDLYGEQTDWSPHLSIYMANRAPNTPSNPSPGDMADGVVIDTALSWIGGDPDIVDIVTYDIYFGTDIAPPKMVSKQSSTSFNPGTLSYDTTYYWQIIAWDNYGASTPGPIWSFKTAVSSSGDNNGDSTSGEDNQPPIANASMSETYGSIHAVITFDGSLSSDIDGYIKNWSWNFDDGYRSSGEITTHTYSKEGTYNVTLTVTDNDNATDTDTITVIISLQNNPPTPPEINGPNTGNINTQNSYSAVSTDADNDTIRYFFDWDDGTYITTTEFLPNGTKTVQNHTWTSPGLYTVKVYAMDELNAVSGTTEFIVLIDGCFCNDIGYLLDNDNDEIYDVFHSNETGKKTVVERIDNIYLIDVNGDGEWDYTFDIEAGITIYQKEKEEETPSFELIIGFIAIVIVIIFYRYKPKLNK